MNEADRMTTQQRPYLWRDLLTLLGPQVLLLPALIFYIRYDGANHFFLHTLMGWLVALTVLLALAERGRLRRRYDGGWLLLGALWAITPDIIYSIGPYHRDWMDVFLFHISLDEILPVAVPILAVFVIGLLVLPSLAPRVRSVLVPGVLVVLILLVGSGMGLERAEGTPLFRVGAIAPAITLPATTGGNFTLAQQRGQPVALLFLPSVRATASQTQLRTLAALTAQMQACHLHLAAISTDTPATQAEVAQTLHLSFPLLSEAPEWHAHPAGSAYGLFHYAQPNPGPVDTAAIVLIGAEGHVLAVRVHPDQSLNAADLTALFKSVCAGQ